MFLFIYSVLILLFVSILNGQSAFDYKATKDVNVSSVLHQTSLIASYKLKRKLACIGECNKDARCLSVSFNSDTSVTGDDCFLYLANVTLNDFFYAPKMDVFNKKDEFMQSTVPVTTSSVQITSQTSTVPPLTTISTTTAPVISATIAPVISTTIAPTTAAVQVTSAVTTTTESPSQSSSTPVTTTGTSTDTTSSSSSTATIAPTTAAVTSATVQVTSTLTTTTETSTVTTSSSSSTATIAPTTAAVQVTSTVTTTTESPSQSSSAPVTTTGTSSSSSTATITPTTPLTTIITTTIQITSSTSTAISITTTPITATSQTTSYIPITTTPLMVTSPQMSTTAQLTTLPSTTTEKPPSGPSLLFAFENYTISRVISDYDGNSFNYIYSFDVVSIENEAHYLIADYNMGSLVLLNETWEITSTGTINTPNTVKVIQGFIYVSTQDGFYKLDFNYTIVNSIDDGNAYYEGIFYNETEDTVISPSWGYKRIDILLRNLSLVDSIPIGDLEPYAINVYDGLIYITAETKEVNYIHVIDRSSKQIIQNITVNAVPWVWMYGILFDEWGYMALALFDSKSLVLYHANGSDTGLNITFPNSVMYMQFGPNGELIVATRTEMNVLNINSVTTTATTTTKRPPSGPSLLFAFENYTISRVISNYDGNTFYFAYSFDSFAMNGQTHYLVADESANRIIHFDENWQYVDMGSINTPDTVNVIQGHIYVSTQNGLYQLDFNYTVVNSIDDVHAYYEGIYYNETEDAIIVPLWGHNRIDIMSRNLTLIDSIPIGDLEPYAINVYDGLIYITAETKEVNYIHVIDRSSKQIIQNITVNAVPWVWMYGILFDEWGYMALALYDSKSLVLYHANGSDTGLNITFPNNVMYMQFGPNGELIVATGKDINILIPNSLATTTENPSSSLNLLNAFVNYSKSAVITSYGGTTFSSIYSFDVISIDNQTHYMISVNGQDRITLLNDKWEMVSGSTTLYVPKVLKVVQGDIYVSAESGLYRLDFNYAIVNSLVDSIARYEGVCYDAVANTIIAASYAYMEIRIFGRDLSLIDSISVAPLQPYAVSLHNGLIYISVECAEVNNIHVIDRVSRMIVQTMQIDAMPWVWINGILFDEYGHMALALWDSNSTGLYHANNGSYTGLSLNFANRAMYMNFGNNGELIVATDRDINVFEATTLTDPSLLFAFQNYSIVREISTFNGYNIGFGIAFEVAVMNGQVYYLVTDFATNFVIKYNENWQYVAYYSFTMPKVIKAIGGYLYLSTYYMLYKLDYDFNIIDSYNGPGSYHHGLYYSAAEDRLYAASRGYCRIDVFAMNLTKIDEIPLGDIQAIGLNAYNGLMYVTGEALPSAVTYIHVLDMQTRQIIQNITASASTADYLDGIVFDVYGYMAVTFFNDNSIQLYYVNGTHTGLTFILPVGNPAMYIKFGLNAELIVVTQFKIFVLNTI